VSRFHWTIDRKKIAALAVNLASSTTGDTIQISITVLRFAGAL
jgi:hypothetical protein